MRLRLSHKIHSIIFYKSDNLIKGYYFLTCRKHFSFYCSNCWSHWVVTLRKYLICLKWLCITLSKSWHPQSAGTGILLIIKILIGTTEGDLFWDTIRDQLLGKPSEEIIECHKPKPILLHTGEVRHLLVLMESQYYALWWLSYNKWSI